MAVDVSLRIIICGYNQEGNNLNCDGALRLIYPKGYNHTSPDKFYTLSGIFLHNFTIFAP